MPVKFCLRDLIGARMLLASVLALAVKDLKDKEFAADASDWFCRGENSLFSFRHICDVLDIEPDMVLDCLTKGK